MDKLADIEARCEAATKGPYHTHDEQIDADYTNKDGRRQHHIVAIVHRIEDSGVRYGCEGNSKDNAQFFAHARQDIPYLLARCKAAEADRIVQFDRAAGVIRQLKAERDAALAKVGRLVVAGDQMHDALYLNDPAIKDWEEEMRLDK